MEPIASSGAGAVFRPLGGGQGEVGALLREGRVLRAEVLAPGPDGSVLLAIGRHTVPAETALRLDPGTRFLVRVAQGEAGIALEMLAPAEEEAALLGALRRVAAEVRPLGELLGELARSLRDAGARSELAPELLVLARALEASAPRAGGDPGTLRSLLASLGLAHEAAVAALASTGGGSAALERLRGDLKAALLRAKLALESAGPEHAALRDSVARALAGLEAEQLLNLAREKAGEPVVLSFPFADGENWTTARLAVPSRREREDGASEQEGAGPWPFRLALGVELSNLGPLRADFTLAPGLLAVRLLVTRAEVARCIESELGGLRQRLASGARAVELQVRLGTPGEAVHGLLPKDIRYLREHSLLNVAG